MKRGKVIGLKSPWFHYVESIKYMLHVPILIRLEQN